MGNSPADTANALNVDIRAEILAGGMDLPERIALYRSDSSRFEADELLSNERLNTWRVALGHESVESMEKRLSNLGISTEDASLVLGRIKADANDPVPDWWEVCERVLGEPPCVEDEALNGFLSTDDERLIPFEDVIAPWIRVGTQLLRERLPDLGDDFEASILRNEQRGLLENLASIIRLILVSDFEVFKMRSYEANDLFLGMTVTKPPNDSYLKFTAAVLDDSWRGYMLEYPGLARLLATRVKLWVHSLGEFIERLDADHDELERVFSPNAPLGRLAEGSRGISDSHNGGRAVVVCRFENGCKVVYKPRQMAVDAAWGKVLVWFNERFDDIESLTRLDVIDRGNYGWMAFAEHLPCADKEEVGLYFKRMGVFLCLVHLLHGNDFHLENVIASGPHPVAIDLETVTVPHFQDVIPEGGVEQSAGHTAFSRSVLRTLLLPMAMAPGRAEARNLGAVGLSIDGAGGRTLHRVLHAINTDFMHWRTVSLDEATKIGATNMQDAMRSKVELVDGSEVIPQDYRGQLVEGYRLTYKALLGVRDELIAEDGPLSLFRGSHVRFLNRATNIYYRLVFETCVETAVRSGLDRWIAADRLAIGYGLGEDMTPVFTDFLLDSEHEAIGRGDVPYFLSTAESLRLCTLDIDACQPIECDEDVLTMSAMDCARGQFEGMSEEDLEVQTKFIESSYVSTLISLRRMMHGSTFTDVSEANNPPLRDLPDEDLGTFARMTIDGLLEQALRNESGQLDWLDVSVDPVKDTSNVSPMDAGIYSGRGGLALLFEIAYRRFNDRRYLEAAAGSLLFEANSLTRNESFFASPSGMLPTGSLMIAGWQLGAHEDYGYWRDLVRKLITQVGPRSIERDVSFDVIGGSAGQILALAHLLKEEDIPAARDLVDELASYIVRHATDQHGGPSWAGKNDSSSAALTGFSHGIAGVALALLHAWRITSKQEYRDMALRAVACEHALRSEEKANWPDYRSGGGGDKVNWDMRAWCHGSPGIALGRSAFVEIEDDPIARDDLEFALASLDVLFDSSTGHADLQSRPHLCCGTAGNGEIMRTIGSRAGRQDIHDRGIGLIKGTVQFQMDGELGQGCMGHGMLQGTAGIAWAALAAEGKVSDQLALMLLGT